MSIQDNCPHCKSPREGNWSWWTCETLFEDQAQTFECLRREHLGQIAKLRDQLDAAQARSKRLESAAREVFLDFIASDHLWSPLESKNMHALRDVLEKKP